MLNTTSEHPNGHVIRTLLMHTKPRNKSNYYAVRYHRTRTYIKSFLDQQSNDEYSLPNRPDLYMSQVTYHAHFRRFVNHDGDGLENFNRRSTCLQVKAVYNRFVFVLLCSRVYASKAQTLSFSSLMSLIVLTWARLGNPCAQPHLVLI